jgi:PAS domain S-box-containing protein
MRRRRAAAVIDIPPQAVQFCVFDPEENENPMKLGPDGPRPPPQTPAALPPGAPTPPRAPAQTPARAIDEAHARRTTPGAALREDPFAALAVRALCVMVAIVGAALILLAVIQRSFGPLSLLAASRAAMGGCLLIGGSVAWEIGRRGARRRSAAVVLLVALGGVMLHAWCSGLGTYAIVLAGSVLLIAAAGALVDMRAAFALGALDMACIAGLEFAERHGWLSRTQALAELDRQTRTASFAMLTIAALLAAWLVRRQLLGTVRRGQEQERRMTRLLQLGSDFTWELDGHARVTYVSPSFETHTTRRVAEFMRLGEADGPAVVVDGQWELLQEDLRARRPYRDRVMHVICQDGTELYLNGSGEPVFDATGRHTGWWGVSRNATAEVMAQRELQRSQAMLDRLVRLSPDAICVASTVDGRVLLANPAFLQFSGLTEGEVMGRNGFELGLWREKDDMKAFGAAIGRHGLVRDFRSVAWPRGGHRHTVLITAAAFDWDGEPVCVMTTRDVTETERAKLEGDAILDNAVVGVCLVREHRLERVNPQLERMMGLPIGSLEGQSTDVLFRDRERFEAFVQRHEAAQAAGETIDVERKAMRADGTKILIRMRGRAVDPKRRQETGTIWVIEDITERRRAEIELAEAKREAEAASRAKSRFLATMSHEIRTPLSGVLGLARLLQDGALDDERRAEYLAHLVDAAETLTGIVSDVLDLSKIEAGHLQVERIPFDLHALVLSAFRTFSPMGRERGLDMRCEVAPDAPREVVGDPVRVRQILSNYLSNALKFTHRGHIALRLLHGVAPGIARIEVHDSGIGIPQELHATLFMPFTQADSSTTRRFGGSGLGLSICRELATLMGGDVGLESDGHSGSCVWVELPLQAADEHDLSTLAGALEAPPPQPLRGLRVLLAEDNPVNRLIVGAMLARLGAEVVEADDGAQAIRQAGEAMPPVHVVLMDLHMPEIDGIEATRRLRAQPATAHLPIIALTAAVLDAERAQAQQAGMNGFVAKPAAEGELLRALWAYVPVASTAPPIG